VEDLTTEYSRQSALAVLIKSSYAWPRTTEVARTMGSVRMPCTLRQTAAVAGLAAVLGLAMCRPVCAEQPYRTDPNGVKILQTLLRDDAATQVRGGTRVFLHGSLPRNPIIVEAPTLWLDFYQNQLAAEQKYDGRYVQIRGIGECRYFCV